MLTGHRISPNLPVLFTVVLCSATWGCKNPPSAPIPEERTEQRAEEPDHYSQRPESFSDSIENFKLSLNGDASVAALEFTYRDLEAAESRPAGSPLPLRLVRLRGRVGPDGKAHLSDPRQPRFSAHLRCEAPLSEGCRVAEIELTHNSSGALSGRAVLRQKILKDAKILISTSKQTSASSLASELAGFDSAQATLRIREVIDGHSDAFEYELQFPRSDEFEYKRIRINGKLAEKSFQWETIINRDSGSSSSRQQLEGRAEYDSKTESVLLRFDGGWILIS